MFGWFKNKNKEIKLEEAPAPVINSEPKEKIVKPKKEKKTRTAKPKAKVEPKVEILKFNFDENNPKFGSIELDWNKEFVDLLVIHGYRGASPEEIVDRWLNDVCRNIIADQALGAPINPNNIINKRSLGEGKTEVS